MLTGNKIYACILLLIITVASALFAVYFIFSANDGLPALQTEKLQTSSSAITVSLPFSTADDHDFKLPGDIMPFVYSVNAFKGQNDSLSLNIYAVVYRKELFMPTWRPNLEDMAEITINDLQNDPDTKNHIQDKYYYNISGGSTVEVRSRYMKGEVSFVQRTLHLADRHCTWTVQAVYRDGGNNKIANTVDYIFQSIKIQKTV